MRANSAGDGRHVDAATRTDRPAQRRTTRVLRMALVALIATTPIVITLVFGPTTWFTWRMFSVVNGDVRYEVVVDDEVEPVSLDGLSYWNRGAHTGTGNLEQLCRRHDDADVARRLVDGRVDAEVRCR